MLHALKAMRQAVGAHPLMQTLRTVRGNQRVVVFTEPLWGIPNSLYLPYVSLYMAALGLTDAMIGLCATVMLLSQVFFSLLSGPITDKLGRRQTLLVCNLFCWSLPQLLWATAPILIGWGVPAPALFLSAAFINGAWRVPSNAWACMVMEDARKEQVISLYSLVYIAGQLTAFLAPLSGWMVSRYSLVPTVQALYFLAFGMMTVKFVLMVRLTYDTQESLRAKRAMRNVSIWKTALGVWPLLRRMLAQPAIVRLIALYACVRLSRTITDSFFGLVLTQQAGLSAEALALLTAVRSGAMLLFYVALAPKLNVFAARRPLIAGFLAAALAQGMLALCPPNAFLLAVAAVIVESCGLSIVNPLVDALQLFHITGRERARMLGAFFAAVHALTAPFGYVAGLLSDVGKGLPFALNLLVLLLGAWAARGTRPVTAVQNQEAG